MGEFMHGFTPNQAGEWDLLFGAQALFGAIWLSSVPGPRQSLSPWPFRNPDQRFAHLHAALRDTVWKLERAADYYAQAAARYGPAVLSWQASHLDQLDLSIYLDIVTVYLRLLPDMWATLVRYTYAPGPIGPPDRGFRDHLKWITKHPAFDPAYSDILSTEAEWFELLAGKDEKGIRDLLIHRFGTFHHSVITDPAHERGFVGSDISVGRRWIVDAHLVLAQVTRGMFSFFDHAVKHQANRIAASCGWVPFDPSEHRAGYLMTHGEPLRSRWLFPVAPEDPT